VYPQQEPSGNVVVKTVCYARQIEVWRSFSRQNVQRTLIKRISREQLKLLPFILMTRLTVSEHSGEAFALRGHNTIADKDENGVVFYSDVTKVHVVPEQDGFAIQVITPEVLMEMDFSDVDDVHEALRLFETRKVLEVDFDTPNSVRIMPSRLEPTAA
jgi:hypothetical protein